MTSYGERASSPRGWTSATAGPRRPSAIAAPGHTRSLPPGGPLLCHLPVQASPLPECKSRLLSFAFTHTTIPTPLPENSVDRWVQNHRHVLQPLLHVRSSIPRCMCFAIGHGQLTRHDVNSSFFWILAHRLTFIYRSIIVPGMYVNCYFASALAASAAMTWTSLARKLVRIVDHRITFIFRSVCNPCFMYPRRFQHICVLPTHLRFTLPAMWLAHANFFVPMVECRTYLIYWSIGSCALTILWNVWVWCIHHLWMVWWRCLKCICSWGNSTFVRFNCGSWNASC